MFTLHEIAKRVIVCRLQHDLDDPNVLLNKQFDFRAAYFITHQLLRIAGYISYEFMYLFRIGALNVLDKRRHKNLQLRINPARLGTHSILGDSRKFTY